MLGKEKEVGGQEEGGFRNKSATHRYERERGIRPMVMKDGLYVGREVSDYGRLFLSQTKELGLRAMESHQRILAMSHMTRPDHAL